MNGDDALQGFEKWLQKIDADIWLDYMDKYGQYVARVVQLDKIIKCENAEDWLQEYYIENVFAQGGADDQYDAWRDMQDDKETTKTEVKQ